MATDIYEIATLESSGVADLTFSLDQKRLFVSMKNGEIHVFDVATRQKIATWDIGEYLGGISLSEDGAFLIVTERDPIVDGQARIYRVDTATGQSLPIWTGGDPYYDVEIVDASTALLTSLNESGGVTGWQATKFDIASATFSTFTVNSSNPYLMVEDSRYTIFMEGQSTAANMYRYDDQTGNIVTVSNRPPAHTPGFGLMTISEAAGL